MQRIKNDTLWQELFDLKKDHYIVRRQQLYFTLPHGLRPTQSIA
jgi:hypothetical protein